MTVFSRTLPPVAYGLFFAVIVALIIIGVSSGRAAAYPTSDAWAQFKLRANADPPVVVPGSTTTEVRFRSYIDKSQSLIPSNGVRSVAMKRYFWVENAGGQIVNTAGFFNNPGGGTVNSLLNAYDVGQGDYRCVLPAGVSSINGCPDRSTATDIFYLDTASLPVGGRVCSRLLVTPHFGYLGWFVTPPHAYPTSAIDVDHGYQTIFANPIWSSNYQVNNPNAVSNSYSSSGYSISHVRCTSFTPPAPTVSAVCVSAGALTGVINPGQTFSYQVTIRNTGSTAWNPSYRLGSALTRTNNYLNSSGQQFIHFNETSPEVNSVPPGGTVTFRFNRTAPDTPGAYPYGWSMMHNGGNSWFGPECPGTITVVQPQATATCSVSISPSSVEIGRPFTVTVTVDRRDSDTLEPDISHNGGGSVAAPLYFRPTSGLSGMPDPDSSQSYGTVAPGETGTATVTNVMSTTAQEYTVYAELQLLPAPAEPSKCQNTVKVGNHSYLKTFGGEVATGGSFISNKNLCHQSGIGGIHTWSEVQSGTGKYVGASAQLSITALLQINGLFSAAQHHYNSSDLPRTPKGLTFANTGSHPYGGSSGHNFCLTDYFTTTRNSSIHKGGWNGSTAFAGNSGRIQYDLPPHGTIVGTTVPVGTQVAVFVDGDVYITGNITFANGAASWGGAPNFALVARGNIYIGPDVTRLDGTYIAQPDTAHQRGTIYTCANDGDGVLAGSVHVDCNRQLVVNGSLIAQNVRFLRTGGTIRCAMYSETAIITTHAGLPADCPVLAVGSPNFNIAEIINYTPEMYLAPSALWRPGSSTGNGSAGVYDALRALPPVF